MPGKAVQVLRRNIGKGFDVGSLTKFLKVIGHYPVGTLVRLSTGDVGFVTGFPPDDPKRPVVAIAENARGEILSHNSVVDLVKERNILVSEVLDHNRHYQEHAEHALQVFTGMQVT